MKRLIIRSALPVLLAGAATAQQGLYSVGADAQDSIPLKWVVGISAIYDDNVNAGNGAIGATEEDSFALSPSLGVSFINVSPQTTWDVFVSLGMNYYLDPPANVDEFNSQNSLGVNLTHRVSERLRFVSRNSVAYEQEPDYAYGYASARTAGAYFHWGTDNSVGYRWSERFGTYTGLALTGTTYADVNDNDRFNWTLYNQFRYQLTPVTVLTADYRYGQTAGDGRSSDSGDQHLLAGIEHRFSPTTIGILRAGAQFRDVDDGDSTISPNVEGSFSTSVNDRLSINSFIRYGMEYYDTVQSLPIGNVEYDDRTTLRLGVTANYLISPMLSVFVGLDYIPSSFKKGRSVDTPPFLGAIPDLDEDLISANIGLSMRFNDFVTGTFAYTFTNSSSDISTRDYDRNRISLGVSAQF